MTTEICTLDDTQAERNDAGTAACRVRLRLGGQNPAPAPSARVAWPRRGTTPRGFPRWLGRILGSHPIEIGAGAGGHAAAWLRDGLERITVTEADPHLLARLRARFAGDDRVTVREVDLTAPSAARHSAVVAFNVLEHIEDDVGALREARARLRPGGVVVMLAPAFELAMSRFDREIGHYRRYSKHTLRAA